MIEYVINQEINNYINNYEYINSLTYNNSAYKNINDILAIIPAKEHSE